MCCRSRKRNLRIETILAFPDPLIVPLSLLCGPESWMKKQRNVGSVPRAPEGQHVKLLLVGRSEEFKGNLARRIFDWKPVLDYPQISEPSWRAGALAI